MANKACNEVVTVANMPMTVFDMISAMRNKYADRVAFRYVEGKDTVVEKTYAQYVQDIRKATGYLQQELGELDPEWSLEQKAAYSALESEFELGGADEDVKIDANRRYVVFTTNGYTIMSRLIEGEFLNYRNVIPADSRTRVTIDTKEFIETIERASLIITERLKNPLRISFTEGRVVVRCQTNLGRVVDEFNADCEGDEVEIGFNNRYLLDALRNARTEKVRMEISGPLSPVKVLPAEGNDFLYLVLPVRFKND